MLSRRPPNTSRPERRQPTKAKGWEKQEEQIEKALPGGKRTPGSGCSRRASRKSDVVGHFARAEGKTTGASSIRVEKSYLQKIVSEALPDRLPVFVFGFDDHEDWGSVRLSDLKCMLETVNAARRGDHDAAQEFAERLIR